MSRGWQELQVRSNLELRSQGYIASLPHKTHHKLTLQPTWRKMLILMWEVTTELARKGGRVSVSQL